MFRNSYNSLKIYILLSASCLEILQNSYNYLETYHPGGVFRNPVCSASLCLIPYFIAVFVRRKMCLVAQFWKMACSDYLFRANIFYANMQEKSYCRVARVFDEFITRFVVYFQGVTVKNRFLSGKF